MIRPELKRDRKGSILINSIFIVVLLVLSSIAFMRWAVDEAHQSEYELARTQAYYVAQYGIMEQVLTSLRKSKPGTLPEARMHFNNGTMQNNGTVVGKFSNTLLQRVSDRGHNSTFSNLYYYDLSATGTVPVMNDMPGKKEVEVSRRVTMRAKLRSFASYMYLTDNEITVHNEMIRFWGGDTLYGRVHSNDVIGIMQDPHFYGQVSTSADDFEHGAGYNPWFAHAPKFGVPEIEFPFEADLLRSKGHTLSNDNGRYQTRIIATPGNFHYIQWAVGTPFPDIDNLPDDFDFVEGDIESTGSDLGIFVEGQLQIMGTVSGAVTIGSEGNMWLIDDIMYSDFSLESDSIYAESPNMLGLISESDIIIKDNTVNGQGNGFIDGVGPIHDHAHIIITAALIALDEQFTFEHQNDVGDTYLWCTPGSGNTTDVRGDIYLRGSVAQKRRGYVHRSNCGSTGYNKNYKYDYRFDVKPPPYILDAVDDKGNLLFDIVWMQEENP